MSAAVAPSVPVLRLAKSDPGWLPAVRAALAVHDAGMKRFAGRWVLDELRRQGAQRTWYPNLRRLVNLGILEKDGESVRGGQRAYYVLRDPNGVREALRQIETHTPAKRRLSFTAVGRSGRSDLSVAADEILRSDFPNR